MLVFRSVGRSSNNFENKNESCVTNIVESQDRLIVPWDLSSISVVAELICIQKGDPPGFRLIGPKNGWMDRLSSLNIDTSQVSSRPHSSFPSLSWVKYQLQLSINFIILARLHLCHSHIESRLRLS